MRTLLLTSLLLSSTAVWAAVPTGFVETSYTSSALNLATGMAWAPDGSGRLFITLKNGQIRIVSLKDGVPETQQGGTLVTRVFATEPSVHTNSECGLIGIAFDPNYVANRYVYVFVTVSASEQRIVRYTDANSVGSARTVVISGLPTVGQNHDGGGLGFGPDGKLYWAIGDLGNGTGVNADLTSLAAKVGRANLDGTPANDNPYNDGVGPNNEYIWARGFRNPFTLTFQPSTGALWVNTVGTSYEQIFVVGKGNHAGYNRYENNQPAGFITPVVKYVTNGVDTRTIAANGAVRSGGVATFTTTAEHGFRKGERLTLSGVTDTSFNGAPVVASVPSLTTFTVAQPALPDATSGGGTATTQALGGSITGGTFFDSTLFGPEYRGNFFFGDYNSGQVTRVTLAADNSVATVDEWGTGFSANVDVSVGPDGALYTIGVTGGVLRRITPAQPGRKLVVSGGHLRVVEGGRAAFTVRLSGAPTAPVTVRVVRALGGSEDLVVSSESLTFTPADWSVPQGVTLAAALDADSAPDVATFLVTAEGLDTEEVVATTIDDNTPRLVLSSSNVVVPENGTAAFDVSLSQRPSGNVTVTVARTQGDGDITVQDGASLQFTSVSWNTPRAVTLRAASDADSADGTATITVAAAGLDARSVLATEADDEPLAPSIISTAVTTAVVGAPYGYDVEARGRPAPTYSLVGTVPEGMSINAATGVITWAPTVEGSAEVSVVAANGNPPDATQTFTLTTKADAPPRAILTRPEDGERVSGTMAEFFGDCVDDVGCTRAEFYVDGELQYTDTRSDNHFHFGGEHNRWDTTGLAPGGHRVRFVVVDTAGRQSQAEVTVCVGNGSCELFQPDAGTGGLDAGAGGPMGVEDESGCGCGAAPVAPLAWLALAALALRRRRAREE
ncbi:PQQ-dependent sugar dehydrogenase [Myxococcus sp. RHSTA-1-4]|uniref:PQQ-dependent sugar dehydrogenase n=1 Tax=Myxococcus sp. RHSTA-1-4 TaxID=2874601 RepID=UPI001CBDAB95|nr:PQQ-dependent sugar dehydrogenase [Myxococcus sp. RHSTA-1-4]MBZ4415360.1 PQQ-dependent sugar dehydrogenase [Myxococcus sp. RHSTA-1-4]